MGAVRILNVIDKLDYNSGVCMVVLNYMRHLNPNKWIFDFAVQMNPEDMVLLGEVKERGGKVFVISKPQIREISCYIHRWESLLGEQGYKMIYGHVPVTALFYLYAAKKSGVPVRVLHSHSTRGAVEILKNLRNMAVSRPARFFATHFAACSEDAGRYLFGAKIAKKKLAVIPNAIDCNRFYPDAARRENARQSLLTEGDELVVGHIGRLSREKNQIFLLRVFAELSARRPASLCIIGGGPIREILEDEAERLGITDRVRFLGVVRKIEEYIPGFDVFCLPSLFEGEPLSALEVQACGVPCVVSNRVTSNIDVTGSVRSLSLDLSYEEWADAIDSIGIEKGASDRAALFRESRYNIVNSATVMDSYLYSLLKPPLY